MKHMLLVRGVPVAAGLVAVTAVALARGRLLAYMRPVGSKERFRLGRFALVELRS
jgi:hypothetical protein